MEKLARNIEPPPVREIKVWRTAPQMLESRAGVKISFPEWFTAVAAAVYDGDVRVRRYFPAFLTICRTMALLRSFQPAPSSLKKSGSIKVSFEDYAISWIIFEPIFLESLHRGDDQAITTRATVAAIANRTNGRPVSAMQLSNELSISKDQAYERLRHAVEHQTIRKANSPNKSNKKLYLPTRMPTFLPHPEDLFAKVPAVGDCLRFVHPVNGEWISLHRK